MKKMLLAYDIGPDWFTSHHLHYCLLQNALHFFFFGGVILVRVNLCLHTFTHMTVTLCGVGDRRLFQKIIAAEKCIVVAEEFMERFEKKY